MTIKPTRFVGILVTATILAVGIWYSRSCASDSGGSGSGGRRGGELVSSIRSEPRTFNRIVARDQTSDLINHLTQGRLVRINRATFDLEPWLAERWESTSDGLTYTLHLRTGIVWSDGQPFSSADVLFSLKAAYIKESVVASSLMVGGQPISATAPDDNTVVLTYAGPSGPGIRLFDQLPILPKHKLEDALASGSFASAWDTKTPPGNVVGTGPFVLREYQPGQRVVLDRNPYYWRKAPGGGALPYLDRIVLEIVPDQNAELLRLQSGAIDLPQDALRPDDFVPVRRSEEQGKLKLVELGIAAEADGFWFCLKPEAKKKDPRFAFVQRSEFRQAISHAVDREDFAQTVFLGEAVPAWGPVTPGNILWFTPNLPRYPYDPEIARALLRGIGLLDRNGNGVVENAAGVEARFTVITQRGLGWYERGTLVLKEQAAKIGIAFDVVPLEFNAMIQRMLACDYDAIYMRFFPTDLDPAGNLDFWLSSGSAHVWNIGQKTAATAWEKELDTLMLQQASTVEPERRRQIFEAAQRLFAQNLPVLYFAAPRSYTAHSTRLSGVIPSVQRPPVLWNADTISVTGPPASGASH